MFKVDSLIDQLLGILQTTLTRFSQQVLELLKRTIFKNAVYSSLSPSVVFFRKRRLILLILRVIVAFLHGPILSEEIKGLQLFDDVVSSGNQLFDFLRVGLILVLHKSELQPFPEISCSLWVLTAKIKQLGDEGGKKVK